MTSAPISDYAAVLSYRSGIGTENANTDVTEELFGSFQNAMSQAQSNQTDTLKEAAGRMQPATNTSKTAGTFQMKTDSSKDTDTRSEVRSKEEPKQSEEVRDTVERTVEDAEKQVVKEVADKLDVTEEEVEEAMETLGLTVMDLSDQANMAALVTQLCGESDPMALVTDETLFMTIQELTVAVGDILDESVQQLSEELSMDSNQVFNMMETSAEMAEGVDLAPETTVRVEVKNELPLEEAQPHSSISEGSEEAGEETLTVQSTEDDADSRQNSGGNQSMMNANQESSPLINQLYQTDAAAAGEVTQAEVPFTSYVDTEDIIHQIGEYVKVHNSRGLSEMEISLNPESLGNIHLNVASREGVITATITTQNESVREALMIQAMTLKEELNDQGIKVEAVEVTVASHEFERDMQEGGQEAQNLFEQQIRKQGRRRLVVDGLEQAEELLADQELSDADRLQIDMMAKSGNSVDFTA